jgi:hypothetical protein
VEKERVLDDEGALGHWLVPVRGGNSEDETACQAHELPSQKRFAAANGERGSKGKGAPPLEEGEGEGNRADEDSADDDGGAGAASSVAVHGGGGSSGLGLSPEGEWRERDAFVVFRHREKRCPTRRKVGDKRRGEEPRGG